MPRPDIEKDLCNAEGFFGPGLLNPFSSSHDKDLNDDFLMKDFENLLKRKPQDVHKRAKLTTDQNAPAIAHLNLSATKPFTALYDRFDDFEDGTYLINQVYFTDCEAAINDYHSEVTRGRQNWLQDAYRDFLPQQGKQRAYRATPLINNLFNVGTSDTTETEAQNGQEKDAESSFGLGIDNDQMLSGPKLYLLKLIEFNKIDVLEKYGFTNTTANQGDMFDDEQQLAEVQSCMTRLMRQTLI